jgi:hypothetical protein
MRQLFLVNLYHSWLKICLVPYYKNPPKPSVPVQSLHSSHIQSFNMDPEELPYESPYERSYNRIVEQLAQGNLERELELQRILEAAAQPSARDELAAITPPSANNTGDVVPTRPKLSMDEAMELQRRRWDGLPPGHYSEGDMVVIIPERTGHNSSFTTPAIGNLSTGAVEPSSGPRPPGMANSGIGKGNEAIGNPTGVVVEPSSDPRPPGMAEPTGGLASNSSTGAGSGSGVVYTPLRDWLRRLGSGAGGQTGSGGGPPCQPTAAPRECPACPPPTAPAPQLCGPGSSGGDSLAVAPLSTPMAILVGAVATVLVCALAAAIGIIIRYLPILMSGLLVLAVLALVWYYSSTHPAAAREWGLRLWDFLRGTATSLVNRVFRRNSQVRVHLILWYFFMTKLRFCGDSAREKSKVERFTALASFHLFLSFSA